MTCAPVSQPCDDTCHASARTTGPRGERFPGFLVTVSIVVPDEPVRFCASRFVESECDRCCTSHRQPALVRAREPCPSRFDSAGYDRALPRITLIAPTSPRAVGRDTSTYPDLGLSTGRRGRCWALPCDCDARLARAHSGFSPRRSTPSVFQRHCEKARASRYVPRGCDMATRFRRGACLGAFRLKSNLSV